VKRKKVLIVPKQGIWGQIADALISPIMYFFSGVWLNILILRIPAILERSQRTHFWNNKKFQQVGDDAEILKRYPKIKIIGSSKNHWWYKAMALAHLPLLGGWNEYVIFRPGCFDAINEPWYIGWKNDHVFGVSMVPITGAARVLIGPDDCEYFGVRVSDGSPVSLQYLGSGKIGCNGHYKRAPLL
jgi:hypothetical protein